MKALVEEYVAEHTSKIVKYLYDHYNLDRSMKADQKEIKERDLMRAIAFHFIRLDYEEDDMLTQAYAALKRKSSREQFEERREREKLAHRAARKLLSEYPENQGREHPHTPVGNPYVVAVGLI